MIFENNMEIRHNRGGFYSLYVDGKFEGNYDSYVEAAKAYGEITREPVNA